MADLAAAACVDHRKAANCQRDHVTGERRRRTWRESKRRQRAAA